MKKDPSSKRIYFFIGTTAELIKIMPVVAKLKAQKVDIKIISSGQNALNVKELEAIFGRIKIDIPFEYKPGLNKTSIFNFSYWAIRTFFKATIGLRKEFKKIDKKKSYVVVHGDTVSSLIGAVIGKFYGLKVAHVEAGLRSFDFLEPFPEEICRYAVSFLTDVHFSPNSWAINNLKNETGIKVNTKKNVVIESLYKAIRVTKKSTIPKELLKTKYFLFMMHRQEHVMFHKDKNREIFKKIVELAPKKIKCVIIMHSLTETFLKRENLLDYVLENPNLITIPRQPYGVFSKIMEGCEFMVSDGGSTQEEAYYLGKPCLIIRNRTERIEGLGENALLAKGDINVISSFIKNYRKYRRRKVSLSPSPSDIVFKYFVND